MAEWQSTHAQVINVLRLNTRGPSRAPTTSPACADFHVSPLQPSRETSGADNVPLHSFLQRAFTQHRLAPGPATGAGASLQL